MVIWQGWGIISFLCFLGTGILGIGLPHNLGWDESLFPLTVFPAAVAFGALNWWAGMKLNQWGPRQRFQQEFAGVEAQVRHNVHNGTFSLGPGAPRPRSFQEAQMQAGEYLASVQASYQKAFNRHRLFWIPMQHISWGILAFGAIAAVGMLLGN